LQSGVYLADISSC